MIFQRDVQWVFDGGSMVGELLKLLHSYVWVLVLEILNLKQGAECFGGGPITVFV